MLNGPSHQGRAVLRRSLRPAFVVAFGKPFGNGFGLEFGHGFKLQLGNEFGLQLGNEFGIIGNY